MYSQESDSINTVRKICRNIDQLEESIDKIRQSQSSEDNYEMILGEYEREYKRHINYLSELIIDTNQDIG